MFGEAGLAVTLVVVCVGEVVVGPALKIGLVVVIFAVGFAVDGLEDGLLVLKVGALDGLGVATGARDGLVVDVGLDDGLFSASLGALDGVKLGGVVVVLGTRDGCVVK